MFNFFFLKPIKTPLLFRRSTIYFSLYLRIQYEVYGYEITRVSVIGTLDNLLAEMNYLERNFFTQFHDSKHYKANSTVVLLFFLQESIKKLNQHAKLSNTFGKVNIPHVCFLFPTFYITLYLTFFIFIILLSYEVLPN